MCSGKECPIKESCYRFTAPVGYWQSYFTEVPYKDGDCDVFWNTNHSDINKKSKKVLKKNK